MDQVEASIRRTEESLDLMPPEAFPSARARGEVSVADVLAAAAETALLERGRLNGLSSFGGSGTAGDGLARAFRDAATAVERTQAGDVEDQLEIAGQVLLDESYGPAVPPLGRGLLMASSHFEGRAGLSILDLGLLLAGLLEGAQRDAEAQTGQGALLEVLLPAAGAYEAARERNLTVGQMVQGTLGAATMGVRNSARMPGVGPNRKPPGREDPGAVAAHVALTGIIKGLLGRRVPPTPAGQRTDNFIMALLSQGIDLFDLARDQPESGVADMLSHASYAGNYDDLGGQSTEGYGAGGGKTSGTTTGV